MFQVVNNLSHRAGAHALRAGVDFLYNDDTITFLRTFRGSYTFSSLANFLTGNYNGFAQTFGDPVVDQTESEPRLLRAGRVARRLATDAEPRAALRPAVPRDDQHRHEQRLAARRLRLDADGLAGPRSSAAARACSSTACRCAPWPTRCCRPATRPTSTQLRQPQVTGLLPTQAGAPVFPNILPDRLPSTTLVSITTMDKDLQNAYSKQANIEVERALGQRPAP